ncbi:hypothetical protein hrd7_25410 [Leptolinea sp. HRD-7]|nr:hypothetical protein hrd7_25410 [Leptolinea sp. HRD-7]
MSPNSGEFKSYVGVKDLYFALITQDDASAYLAGTPELLAPVTQISAEHTSSLDTQYADDQPFDVNASEGESKLTIDVTSVPMKTLATLLGKPFDDSTGRMIDNGGGSTPPDVAILYRSRKSNGKFRYFCYQKGKFSPPKDEATTKTDKAEPKPQQLVFTAVKTIHQFTLPDSTTDGLKRIMGDEDTVNFSGTGWFTQVQVPGSVAPSALALSSSTPTGGATGVSRTSNLTLTFNNALNSHAVKNVTLLDATNTVVASTITIDSTGKIITIDPTPTLAATTAHTIVAVVVDVFGQALVSIVKFTTGS